MGFIRCSAVLRSFSEHMGEDQTRCGATEHDQKCLHLWDNPPGDADFVLVSTEAPRLWQCDRDAQGSLPG